MERSQAASRSAAPGTHSAHPLPARSRCLSGRTGTKGLPANFAGLEKNARRMPGLSNDCSGRVRAAGWLDNATPNHWTAQMTLLHDLQSDRDDVTPVLQAARHSQHHWGRMDASRPPLSLDLRLSGVDPQPDVVRYLLPRIDKRLAERPHRRAKNSGPVFAAPFP